MLLLYIWCTNINGNTNTMNKINLFPLKSTSNFKMKVKSA